MNDEFDMGLGTQPNELDKNFVPYTSENIMFQREKLYKIDSKGKTRVWWIEYNSEKYRTHSGIMDGAIVSSGWQYPAAKNEGRSNATTVAEQVVREVDAEYVKKQHQGKYHPTLEATSSGAKFVECMLANKYDPKKHAAPYYLSQPKLDGIRCLISKDGMQSRQGKPIVSCPHILEALDPFFEKFPNVILDGELYNHELKDNFEKIVSLVRKTKPTTRDYIEAAHLVQYWVYDAIFPDNMEGMSFVMRNEFVERNVEGYDSVVVVPTFDIRGPIDVDIQLSVYIEEGYEGQMLRLPKSQYEGKRSNGLLKHKQFEDEEFPIVMIEEGLGNWAGYAKSVTILLPDGTMQNAGMRGSQEYLKQVLKDREQYKQATVRYQNKTVDGKLRFPVVTALYGAERDL